MGNQPKRGAKEIFEWFSKYQRLPCGIQIHEDDPGNDIIRATYANVMVTDFYFDISGDEARLVRMVCTDDDYQVSDFHIDECGTQAGVLWATNAKLLMYRKFGRERQPWQPPKEFT